MQFFETSRGTDGRRLFIDSDGRAVTDDNLKSVFAAEIITTAMCDRCSVAHLMRTGSVCFQRFDA